MLDRTVFLVALSLAITPAAALAQDNAQGNANAQSNDCLHAAPTDRPVNPDCATNKATGQGASLSQTLSRSGGVITPPPTGDAGVMTPPPQGNTPVIPPPGTPGGNLNIQPK